MNIQPNYELDNLVQVTELTSEYQDYNAKRTALGSKVLNVYLSVLDDLYNEDSDEADAKLRQSCSQYLFNSAVNSRCSVMLPNLKKRYAQKQCDKAVQKAQLNKMLFEDTVSYGDGVQLQQISFKNLVCQASARGIILKTKRKKILAVDAIDIKTQQSLFTASMIRSGDDTSPWVVEKLRGAVANTKFADIEPSRLIQCLLSSWGC